MSAANVPTVYVLSSKSIDGYTSKRVALVSLLVNRMDTLFEQWRVDVDDDEAETYYEHLESNYGDTKSDSIVLSHLEKYLMDEEEIFTLTQLKEALVNDKRITEKTLIKWTTEYLHTNDGIAVEKVKIVS